MTKKHGIVTLLALLVTLAATLIGTPAQADTFTNIRNYHYKSKCLDVDTNHRVAVQIWSCDNGSDEKWSHTFLSDTDENGFSMLQISNLMTGNCVGVKDDAVSAGSRIVVLPCADGSTVWSLIYANNENFDGWHQQFRNRNSGLCLDLKDDNGSNGTPVQLWPCTNQLAWFNGAQLWML